MSLRNASSRTSGFAYMIEYSYDRVVQLEDGDALTEDSSKSVGCSTLANAFRYFVGICRSSVVKEVKIDSVALDKRCIEELAAAFRTMRVGNLTLDCQTSAVEALQDALGKLFSLDYVFACNEIPANVLTSDLLRSLAQKNAFSIVFRGCQVAGTEHDVLDNGLIEFLLRPHNKTINVKLQYANISSEFTSKLLEKMCTVKHKADVDLVINEFDEVQEDAYDFLEHCTKEAVSVSYRIPLSGRRVAVLKHGCTDVSNVHFLTFSIGAPASVRRRF